MQITGNLRRDQLRRTDIRWFINTGKGPKGFFDDYEDHNATYSHLIIIILRYHCTYLPR